MIENQSGFLVFTLAQTHKPRKPESQGSVKIACQTTNYIRISPFFCIFGRMKKLLKSLLPLLAVLAAACGSQTPDLKNYTLTVYAPSHASGFEIVGAEGRQSTLLKVFNPWQGAENTETMLFIARNGEKAPAGFTGQTVEAGAKRIFCMSSTMSRCSMPWDRRPRDRGFRPGLPHQHLCHNHTPTRWPDVGFDGNVDYELLLAQRPDLVLLFGVSGASGMEPKLREMGIPFVYIGEYLEESPLGKANGWSPSRKSPTAGQKAKPFSPRFPNATMRSKNGSPQPRPPIRR